MDSISHDRASPDVDSPPEACDETEYSVTSLLDSVHLPSVMMQSISLIFMRGKRRGGDTNDSREISVCKLMTFTMSGFSYNHG